MLAGISLDPSISIGNVMTMLTGVGLLLLWSHRFFGRFDKIEADVKSVQEQIKDMSSVLMTLARQDVRLDNLEGRLTRQQEEIDMLRKGEGFILPLVKR